MLILKSHSIRLFSMFFHGQRTKKLQTILMRLPNHIRHLEIIKTFMTTSKKPLLRWIEIV